MMKTNTILQYLGLLGVGLLMAGGDARAQVAPPAPEISVISPEGWQASDGQSLTIIDQTRVGEQRTHTMTIKNTGTADLTGLAATLTKPADDPNLLEVTQAPAAALAPGESTTVVLRFSPAVFKTTKAWLHIASNDADENPFDVQVWGYVAQPWMEVTRVYTPPNPPRPPYYDETPPQFIFRSDQTWAFGTVAPGESKNLSLMIWNRGSADLAGLALSFTGDHAGDWEVTQPPPATVAPNMRATFTVKFTPSAKTMRRAVLSIASNDVAAPRDIPLTGRGWTPEISVKQDATVWGHGKIHDFKWRRVGSESSTTFTILNEGQEDLTGLALSLDGAEAGDFLITQDVAVTTLATGASTTFTVGCKPTATGVRNATVHIASNDEDEDPFDVKLACTGTQPEIRVETTDGVELPQGGLLDLGTQKIHSGSSTLTLYARKDFVVRNTGVGPLHLSDVTGLGTLFDTTLEWIPEGGSLTLPVTFRRGVPGTHTWNVTLHSDDEDENPYVFGATVTAVQPIVEVEPAGTLGYYGIQHELGPVAIGTAKPLTFTFRNTGNMALNMTAKMGDPSTVFTIVTPPAGVVEPGESTTMTVMFAPKLHGRHAAFIRITDNVPRTRRESPYLTYYYLSMRGTGVPGYVSFAAETFRAAHGDAQGLVTLKRTQTDVAATVEVETLAGTAQTMPPFAAAQPGLDYTPPQGQAAVVSFAIGEAQKTVAVPLLAPAGRADLNRHLKLRLRHASPEAALYGTTEATLRILGADSTQPTLQLNAPAPGADITTAPLMVQGVAGDAKGIDRVEVRLNENELVTADLDVSAQTPSAVPFAKAVYPVSGTNVLVVTAYDPRGNSTSVTREFTFSGEALPEPPEIMVEDVETGMDLADGGTWHLGKFYTDESLRLRVTNKGKAALTNIGATLTGTNMVDASDLRPGLSLEPGGSIELTLKTKTTGVPADRRITASVQITSNDADENPFDLTVTGNLPLAVIAMETAAGEPLSSGSIVHFGPASVGSTATVTQTLTVRNIGDTDLTALNVSIQGGHRDDFIVTQKPLLLAAGESGSMTLQFKPLSAGLRYAPFLLNSTFSLSLYGDGVKPDMQVLAGSTPVADGGTVSFGAVARNASVSQVLTIKNAGKAALTGLTLTKDGPQAGDYEITGGLTVTELAPGASTTVTVRLTPAELGVRSAALHIASNEADENPFDVVLSATGTNPEIRVESSEGTEIAQGSTLDFGGASVGSGVHVTKNIVLRNLGVGALRISSVTLGGAAAGEFSLMPEAPLASVPEGAGRTLPIRFTPATHGVRTAVVTILSDDEDEEAYVFTVTGTGLAPVIQIERPDGIPVQTDVTQDFGVLAVGTTKSLTYTIRNPGNLALTLAAVVEGAHAGNFTITTPPAATVPPGESTTMTVQFAASGTTERQAVLRLTHNASTSTSAQSLMLNLRGLGVTTQVLFPKDAFVARHGETQGWVTVTRTEARVATTVEVETELLDKVSDQPNYPRIETALPDVDFTPLSGPAALVSFAIGETEKQVAVPLLAPASGAKVTRHLGLKLKNPSAGATIHLYPANRNTSLIIAGKDTAKPTLTVTSPAAGTVDGPAQMYVQGKAWDALGMHRVELKLNDGPAQVSEMDSGYSGVPSMAYPFYLPITPVNGPNVLVVTAYDLVGNSTSVTRKFTFRSQRTLQVETLDGESMTQTSQAGTVSLVATPAGSAAAIRGTTTPSLKRHTVAAGAMTKLTAVAKPGYVFSRWVTLQDPSPEMTRLGEVLTFVMPETDVSVRAEFVPSPFVTPAYMGNAVHVLTSQDWGGPLEDTILPAELQGHLSGALTAAGSFSGKLLMNGQSLPVVATLYANTPAVFTVAGKKVESLPLPVPGAKLQILNNNSNNNDSPHHPFRVVITTTDAGVLLNRAARRAIYNSTNKVVSQLLNRGTRGHYTLATSAMSESLGGAPPATGSPAGHGYATLNVTSTGTVTLTGMLADGTSMTMSSVLVTGHAIPVYVALPTPGGTTKKGVVMGDVVLVPIIKARVEGLLRWYRPAAANARVRLYPDGWPGGIHLGVAGAPYDALKSVEESLLLEPAYPNTPNATLTFTLGGLAQPITLRGITVKKSTVMKVPGYDAPFTLTLDPVAGHFSGSFTPAWDNGAPATTRPVFRGVLIQKPDHGFGLGFFIGESMIVPEQESGAVSLQR